MCEMLPYGTRKGKDDEIKLFHGRRGRHLCGKRLEVFVCVRMVSAEASAQEMTALHHSIKTSVYKGYKQDKIEMRGDRANVRFSTLSEHGRWWP